MKAHVELIVKGLIVDEIGKLTVWAEAIASRWNLVLDEPIKLAAGGIVYKVSVSGRPAVLKVRNRFGVEGGAVPFLRQVPSGIAADLLRSSPLRRVILLEFLEGDSLRQIVENGQEARAEILLAEAAARLKKAVFPYPFVLADLSKNIASSLKKSAPKLSGPNTYYLERTATLFEHLVQTTKRKTVIHGDLHFENVIASPQGARMIDAKGLRADPSSEFATALVDNDTGQSLEDLCNSIQRRANVFAPIIEEDCQRIIQWGAVIWVTRCFKKELRSGTPHDNWNPLIPRYLDLAGA